MLSKNVSLFEYFSFAHLKNWVCWRLVSYEWLAFPRGTNVFAHVLLECCLDFARSRSRCKVCLTYLPSCSRRQGKLLQLRATQESRLNSIWSFQTVDPVPGEAWEIAQNVTEEERIELTLHLKPVKIWPIVKSAKTRTWIACPLGEDLQKTFYFRFLSNLLGLLSYYYSQHSWEITMCLKALPCKSADCVRPVSYRANAVLNLCWFKRISRSLSSSFETKYPVFHRLERS